MAFIFNMFGNNPKKGGSSGRSAPKKSDPNSAINTLRTAITKLDKRETHLEKQIDMCVKKAQAKVKRKDKRGALLELKKKKSLINQLDGIMGKKLNLEKQIMSLEEAMMNVETVQAMKHGAAAMKQATAQTDIGDIDDMMDDIAEANDNMAEINEALNTQIDDDYDDEALMEELGMMEELEAEEAFDDLPVINAPSNTNKQPANTNSLADLPTAPTGKITQADQDEDELNSLLMMN